LNNFSAESGLTEKKENRAHREVGPIFFMLGDEVNPESWTQLKGSNET
jgi:hypothetical protein